MPTTAVMLAMKIAAGGGAAPARVNFTKKQGTGATAAINTTGANYFAVWFFCASGSTPSVSSDSQGNTWTLQFSTNGTGGDCIRLYTGTGGGGGASHTVTPAGTGGADITHFVAYSGGTGYELPASVDDTSSPYSTTTGSSTTVANSMVMTGGEPNTGTTPNTVSCSAPTVFSQETDFATYWGGGVADGAISSTGTQVATWTSTNSPTSFCMGIIVLKGT